MHFIKCCLCGIVWLTPPTCVRFTIKVTERLTCPLLISPQDSRAAAWQLLSAPLPHALAGGPQPSGAPALADTTSGTTSRMSSTQQGSTLVCSSGSFRTGYRWAVGPWDPGLRPADSGWLRPWEKLSSCSSWEGLSALPPALSCSSWTSSPQPRPKPISRSLGSTWHL